MKFGIDDIARAEGWGKPSSGIWFIGMEPGGDWIDSWQPTGEKYYPYDGKKKIRTPTWKIAAKIVAGLKGEDWANTWEAHWENLGNEVYWNNALPLPRPKFGQIEGPYAEFLKEHGIYEADKYWQAIKEKRGAFLRGLLSKNESTKVICFGENLHGNQAELLGIELPGTAVANLKVVKRQGLTVLFTPFLTNRYVNSKNDSRTRKTGIKEIIAELK
jgi:hypothetical protein